MSKIIQIATFGTNITYVYGLSDEGVLYELNIPIFSGAPKWKRIIANPDE